MINRMSKPMTVEPESTREDEAEPREPLRDEYERHRDGTHYAVGGAMIGVAVGAITGGPIGAAVGLAIGTGAGEAVGAAEQERKGRDGDETPRRRPKGRVPRIG
jgi:uncharacterized protein YcfJ